MRKYKIILLFLSSFLFRNNVVAHNDSKNKSAPTTHLYIERSKHFFFSPPIELLEFRVDLNSEKKLQVIWSTAAEKGNSYFEIEKSVDGENWEIVQEVKGSGTTSKKHSYQVIDPYPYTSVSYYRIKQLDFDDSYSYSPIVSIDLSNEGLNALELYPNPTNGQITIQGEASELSDFHLYDVTGRDKTSVVIITQLNSHKFILDLSALNSGIYYFRSNSQVFKIIKI